MNEIMLSFVLQLAFLPIPFWIIFKRAGIHPAKSLICLIPVMGVALACTALSFAEWKNFPRSRS
jgi:hypothetical protein